MTDPAARARAVGFIQRQVSGVDADRHEEAMRQGAEERDFDWAGTLYADRHLESNHIRVLATVQRTGARAVFLPSVEHLDKRDIDVLASHVPVYCVADGAARSIFTDDPDPTCAPPVTKIAHTSSKSPKRRRARSTQG